MFLLGASVGFVVARSPSADGPSVRTVPVVRTAAADAGAAALVPARSSIRIAFVGDVNGERVLGERLRADPERFVGPFAPTLRAADLTVANLEAAIATGGRAEDKEFTFRVPPTILDGLAAAGVDVVSVANNHGIDFGPEGLAETLEAKADSIQVDVIGVGADEDEAYEPVIVERGGWRVAVLAATQVLDADRIARWTAREDRAGLASAKRVDRLVDEVEAVRRRADTVVVYLHWGVETEECPSAGQRELAAALVDAGADIVVGTHAHRVQGGGHLGEAVVHYGLGNFLFGAVSDASSRTGVFVVEVSGREIVGYEWIPGRIRASVPEPLRGEAAAAEVDRWEDQRRCTDLSP